MSEHRSNPVAVANSRPTQMVQALDLGEGMALLGIKLMPVLDEDGNMVVLLVGMGGRQSDLVPTDPRPVVICELAKASLAGLRKALGGEDAPAPGLVVVP